MIDRAAWRSLRSLSQLVVRKEIDLRVEGLHHLPYAGPVLLAARHYHHLYDGCAILATIPRQVQVVVALDWIERPFALKGMQVACQSAGWPTVFRNGNGVNRSGRMELLRAAMSESLEILRLGRVLLVFPEGYPTIDPHGSPKATDDAFLPFQTGFARIALDAWSQNIAAKLIPVGFDYRNDGRWMITMRFGDAIVPDPGIRPAALAAEVERRVIELSKG